MHSNAMSSEASGHAASNGLAEVNGRADANGQQGQRPVATADGQAWLR